MFDPVAYINEPRWRTMSLGLDRIRELLDRLGNPHHQLRFVHVAGTNGKGSTCSCTASILQAAGYRVGLFTSPYVERFEERIQINATTISPDDLRSTTLAVRDAAEAMDAHPTEFELMTAVAFLYFERQQCDIVVIEVGMGGRLDSTNVIECPEVCLICPIGFDHRAYLGNTIAEIAGEKAGIIKDDAVVVSAYQLPEARDVLVAQAQQHHASLQFIDPDCIYGANDDFSYGSYSHLRLSLLGSYQLGNAALAIEGCAVLQARGWDIGPDAVREGLAQVKWPGRFDLVHRDPDIIIDGAHNIQATTQLISELSQRYPARQYIFCLGVMADKDYQDMLALIAPVAKLCICYAPEVDRALPAATLAAEFCKVLADQDPLEHPQGCSVVYESSPQKVVTRALAEARDHDVICCCGSLYGIGGIKRALKAQGVLAAEA